MAEEVGIVMSLYDQVSPMLKTIAGNTRAFDKSLDDLEQGLKQYDKVQTGLTKDLSALKKAMEESNQKVIAARKEYKKLNDEASKGALDEAIEEQAQLKRRLTETESAIRNQSKLYEDLYSKARQAAKGIKDVSTQASIADNRAGNGTTGILSQLRSAGLASLVGDSIAQGSSALIESALGQPIASAVNSTLSGAVSGAAMGSMLGLPGAVGGAVIGGVSGLASGITQVGEAQDDAFKSYYGALYETASEATEDSLSAGMTVAGQREQDQIAFAQRFGSGEAAQDYLDQVKAMAVNTNYTYDEITGYSKSLLNSYSPEETLGVLQKLSDATAGLNLNSSDVNMFISGLSRMRTTGKVTQEYMDYYAERGLDVDEAIARGVGISKSKVRAMVSGGKIGGAEAAQAILDYIQEEFGGLSEKLASTYDAMVDNLGDAMTNVDAAMGGAYEEKAKEGLQVDIDAYGGALGDALAQANEIIGEGKAIAENLDRQYSREALSALTLGTSTTIYGEDQANRLSEMHDQYTSLVDQYQNATEEDKAVIASQIEALKEEAQAMADSAYDASEMSQDLHDVNLDLISAIRENTAALGSAPWMQDYETEQEESKGLVSTQYEEILTNARDKYNEIQARKGYAFGLDRVPYDNYLTYLHEGERVLTASQAREMDRGGRPPINITVSGNTFGAGMDEAAVAEAIADTALRKILAGFQG